MLRIVGFAFGLVVLSLAALVLGAGPGQAQGAFYQATADELKGEPGSVIRVEKVRNVIGGTEFRMLYRSQGLRDEPIAVSGMVFVPQGTAPEGGWPVVAWGHPTSGVVPECAPSLANGASQVQGLTQLLEHGFVVAATDYPGLGTPGPHPFLVGISEGRAVLDSMRAARQLVGGAVDTGSFLWGHSQGGHAVLYAADIAGKYAPELKILGVAAAAPATDLATLLRDDLASAGGKNLLALALWSWGQAYDVPIADVIAPEAMKTVDRLANSCLETILDLLPDMLDGNDLQRRFLSVEDISKVAPWQKLMDDNTVGALPPHIPVLLVQGSADTTVEPAVTKAYLAQLCASRSHASLLPLDGVDHLSVAEKGAPAAIEWMSALLAGKPVASDCS